MTAKSPKGARTPLPWRRWTLKTLSVDDCRPRIFNPRYPWWLSGEAGDGSYVTIVAFLPVSEPLTKYWDDAFDTDYTDHPIITFTDRFPKPDYFKG